MSDQFAVVIVIVVAIWLVITVAFGVIIVKMIRVNGSHNAAGSGIPKSLDRGGDAAGPVATETRPRRRAKGRR